MSESLTDETLAEKPGHSTGPRSDTGKSRSSKNRLTHGCCSETAILQDEDPEEFEFTIQAWFDNYGPSDEMDEMLVHETALAHWHFKRNRRRLEETERTLPTAAADWKPEDHQRYTNFRRYKTAAERDFLRWFKLLENHCDREHHRAHLNQMALAKLAAFDRRWVNRKEERMGEVLKIRQYVTVDVNEGGQAVTTLCPPNEFIIKEAAESKYPPLLLTRFINFPAGVPPEYAWTRPNDYQLQNESTCVQKIWYENWLKLIEREKSAGHVGPLNPDR